MANTTRNLPTVEDLAENYLSKHAVPKKRPKSVHEDKSLLTRLALPKLGNLKAVEVRHKDIQYLHNSLQKRLIEQTVCYPYSRKCFLFLLGGDVALIIPFLELKIFMKKKDIAGYQILNYRS